MKKFIIPLLCTAMSFCGCKEQGDLNEMSIPESTTSISLREVAKLLSALPMESEHLDEVHSAVGASSGNGYDEEYMMRDLLESPGAGVGDSPQTRAGAKSTWRNPIRNLIEDYLSQNLATKAGAADVQRYLDALSESEMQIYWPYSEDWDGEEYPIITFDPGYGAESNYGYVVRPVEGGLSVVDSVYVDEAVAAKHPVWVINQNDDSSFTPIEMYSKIQRQRSADAEFSARTKASEPNRTLYLKSFTMLRNYDCWFAGASEFWVKCGAVKNFKASTEAELKNYSPSVTDFMFVVKRKQLGKEIPFDTILMTDFTDQLEKIAFMVTEDDGGTQTSWKCSAIVKVESKSYGFDLELPFNEKDDIVWRGQLATSYFPAKEPVESRFGDVKIKFSLE